MKARIRLLLLLQLSQRAIVTGAQSAGSSAPQLVEGCLVGQVDTPEGCADLVPLLTPVSNIGTNWGAQCGAMGMLAGHQINHNNGSVVGEEAAAAVQGVRLKVVPTDTGFNPVQGVGGLLAHCAPADGASPCSALIGPLRSPVATSVNVIASVFGLPEVAWGSTSSELSDVGTYPTFTRVIPEVTAIGSAIVGILATYEFRNVAVIYTKDAFGNAFLATILRNTEAQGVRVVKIAAFFLGDAEGARAAVRTLMNSNVHIVVACVYTSDADTVMFAAEEAGLTGGGTAWIQAFNMEDKVVSISSDPDRMRRIIQGHINVMPVGNGNSERWAMALAAYRETILGLMSTDATIAAVLDPEVEPAVPGMFDWCGFAYDATWLLALALAKADDSLRGTRAWGTHVVDMLKSVQLENGVSGKVRLDGAGNRDTLGLKLRYTQWLPGVDGFSTLGTLSLNEETGAWDTQFNGPDTESQMRFPGNRSQVPSDGWQCPPGELYSREMGCMACPPGSVLNVNRVCETCQAGTYAPVGAVLTECLKCDFDVGSNGGWQNASGATACIPCPLHSSRALGSPGLSVSECFCDAGYYLLGDALPGEPCRNCPDGAVCPGNGNTNGTWSNTLPFPAEGYWAPAPKATGREPLLHACSVDRCVGGGDFAQLCHEGYRDALCTVCDDGYFSVGGICMECQENEGSNVVIWLVGAGSIFCIWMAINTVAAGGYNCFDITLLFLQVLSNVQSLGLSVPSNLSIFATIVAIFNFDLDFVAPNCMVFWAYWESHALMLLLPIAVMTIAFAKIVVATKAMLIREKVAYLPLRSVVKRLLFNPDKFTRYYTPDETAHLPRSASEAKRSKDRLEASGFSIEQSIPRQARGELATYANERIVFVVSFFVVIYNGLCSRSLSAFLCVERGDGDSFLLVAPHIVCGSDQQRVIQATSCLGIVFYVIGVPGCMLYLLRSAYRKNHLNTESVLGRLGCLYMRYEADYYYWEVVLMMRRFALNALLAVLVDPFKRAVGHALVLMLSLVSGAVCSPFKDIHVDILDTVSLLTVLAYLCVLLIVSNQGVEFAEEAGWASIYSVITMTCVGMYFTFAEVKSKREHSKATRVIEPLFAGKGDEDLTAPLQQVLERWKNLAGCILQVTNELLGQDSPETELSLGQLNCHLAVRGHPTLHPCHPILYHLQTLIGVRPQESGPILLPLHRLRPILEGAYFEDLVRSSIREDLAVKSDGAGELANSIKPEWLAAWARHSLTQPSLQDYAELTLALHYAVGDTGMYGCYSNLLEASVLRSLIGAFPNLLDHVIGCSDTEQQAFRTHLCALFEVTESIQHHNGVYASLVSDEDHSALLFWSTFASPEERATLRNFMNVLVEARAAANPKDAKDTMHSDRMKIRNRTMNPPVAGTANSEHSNSNRNIIPARLSERVRNRQDSASKGMGHGIATPEPDEAITTPEAVNIVINRDRESRPNHVHLKTHPIMDSFKK